MTPSKSRLFNVLIIVLYLITGGLLVILVVYYISILASHRLSLNLAGLKNFLEINKEVSTFWASLIMSIAGLAAVLNLREFKRAQAQQRQQQNIAAWLPIYTESIQEFKIKNEALFQFSLTYATNLIDLSFSKGRTIKDIADLKEYFNMLPPDSLLHIEVNQKIYLGESPVKTTQAFVNQLLRLLFIPDVKYISFARDFREVFLNHLVMDLVERLNDPLAKNAVLSFNRSKIEYFHLSCCEGWKFQYWDEAENYVVFYWDVYHSMCDSIPEMVESSTEDFENNPFGLTLQGNLDCICRNYNFFVLKALVTSKK